MIKKTASSVLLERFRLVALVACAAVAASTPSGIAAAPPDAIHYQGVLRDASGEPLDGTYDMVFRFWSAETAGDEILVDAHDAANGNPIDVDDGLLSVRLGQGVVSDGAGPGTYTSLAAVFGDYTDVWLSIRVDGETLSPRVQVISAGHALNAQNAENADSLGGLGPGSYLDTSSTAQTKAGPLTVSKLEVQQDEIRMSMSDAVLNYDEFFEETTLWAGQDNGLLLRAGDTVFEGGIEIYNGGRLDVEAGNGFFNFVNLDSSAATVEISPAGDLQMDGDLSVDGGLLEFGSPDEGALGYEFPDTVKLGFPGFVAQFGYIGIEKDEKIRVQSGGKIEFLAYDASSTNRVVAQMQPNGTLSVNDTITTGSPYNVYDYSSFGIGNADAPAINGQDDVYVTGDLEVDGGAFVEGPIVMNEDGPNGVKQQIQFYDQGSSNDERLQWDDDPNSDRFEFSDDVRIFGDLLADTKNFVQNHPERDDLQIVYTALEGDEATVFTRGFARLVDGRAVVELGETFRHVANPDLGLTAHLTPRGGWAELYVESLTPGRLVVRAAPGAPEDLAFDYLVLGLRVGYEDFPVLREKGDEAFLPAEGDYAAEMSGHPELQRATALSRYQAMHGAVHGGPAQLSGAQELKQAIGQREKGLVYERGSDVAVRDLAEVPEENEQRDGEVTKVEDAPAPVASDEDRSGASGAGVEGAVAEASRDLRAERLHAAAGDLTRMVPVSEPVEAGDVLALDPGRRGAMRRAREAESRAVFGIVAADPGLVLAAAEEGAKRPEQAPVALAGVVRCKVDADFGGIQPGDLLAASSNPGHAMRSRDPLPGTVIGKALEPLASGTGTIEILVMPR